MTQYLLYVGAAAVFVVFFYGVALPFIGLKTGSERVTVAPSETANVETVSLVSEGLRLEGWWMPAAVPRANLIFVHGAGSSRFSPFFNTLGFYEDLQAAGISVLTFDQRNHGNSDRTDGYLRMGATEYKDVLTARRWLSEHTTDNAPVIICGLSMGAATAIYALAEGVQADGLLLYDPMLNTQDAMALGGWVGYGLPPAVFKPMAILTPYFWGLARGKRDALAVATTLNLPIHIAQNRDDPITRALWSTELAQANTHVTLSYVPPINSKDPCMADKGRWGTHAAAYHCHPKWVMADLEAFIERL